MRTSRVEVSDYDQYSHTIPSPTPRMTGMTSRIRPDSTSRTSRTSRTAREVLITSQSFVNGGGEVLLSRGICPSFVQANYSESAWKDIGKKWPSIQAQHQDIRNEIASLQNEIDARERGMKKKMTDNNLPARFFPSPTKERRVDDMSSTSHSDFKWPNQEEKDKEMDTSVNKYGTLTKVCDQAILSTNKGLRGPSKPKEKVYPRDPSLSLHHSEVHAVKNMARAMADHSSSN